MADTRAISDGLRTLAERLDPDSITRSLPTLDELTAHYVRGVVALFGGNKTAAARALDISHSTVTKWVKWEPENTRGEP